MSDALLYSNPNPILAIIISVVVFVWLSSHMNGFHCTYTEHILSVRKTHTKKKQKIIKPYKRTFSTHTIAQHKEAENIMQYFYCRSLCCRAAVRLKKKKNERRSMPSSVCVCKQSAACTSIQIAWERKHIIDCVLRMHILCFCRTQ